MSDLEHQPKEYYDSQGTQLPPFEIKSPSPDFGDDLQGTRIREANRAIEEAKKRHTKRNILIGAGSVAAALALVVPLSLKGGSGHDTAPKAEATASAPATPGAAENPSSRETAATNNLDFSFTAENYKNNPKLLMSDFIEKYNTWQNTGYSKEAADAPKRFQTTDEEYAKTLTQASDNEWEKDVLVGNWREIPSVVSFMNQDEVVHSSTIALALKTEDGNDSTDIEHYQRFLDLDPGSVVVDSATANKIVVSGLAHGRDNSNMNRAGSLIEGINPNGEHGGFTLTFIRVGDQFKLSDVESYNG